MEASALNNYYVVIQKTKVRGRGHDYVLQILGNGLWRNYFSKNLAVLSF